MPQPVKVRCTAASRKCAKAGGGKGCYHRLLHRKSNNCLVATALDTGLAWCNFRQCMHKCAAES